MGSKWAHSTCLCTPNSPKVSLEKHIFDPFLTYFWSQTSPFLMHFVTLEWPKWLARGSKGAHFTCLCTPNGPRSFLERHNFDPLLVTTQPIFKAFCDFAGAKNGLQWAHFTGLCTPNGLGSFLEKHIFHPFLTLFLSQNSPFSRHFGILRGPKRATTSSKRAKNTCFGIPFGCFQQVLGRF